MWVVCQSGLVSCRSSPGNDIEELSKSVLQETGNQESEDNDHDGRCDKKGPHECVVFQILCRSQFERNALHQCEKELIDGEQEERVALVFLEVIENNAILVGVQ